MTDEREKAEADRIAAQRLADAKAAEAKARAEAEAAAKLKAEREAHEAAEKRAAEAKAEADRKQAEAKAEADRIAAEEAAERGKLTDEQIANTMAAIAAAIRAKQIDKLGFPTLKDIARSASGIGSNDVLRNLCNISCRRLVASGLTKPNPNAGKGKPNFIIA